MPLANRLAVMFGLNLKNKVLLSEIAEGSETPAAIALVTARSFLKIKADAPLDVLEGDRGFVVVGKTHAVFVPDTGEPQIRRIAENAATTSMLSKNKQQGENFISSFRPRNMFKKIRNIIHRHVENKLIKGGYISASGDEISVPAEALEAILSREHQDEQARAICDLVRTMLAEAPMDQVDQIMAYEQGDLSEEDTLKLFSELIKSGLAWKLQGAYGRQAQRFIQGGYISKQGKILKEAGADEAIPSPARQARLREGKNRDESEDEPELTAGQKAKALLSDPQYGAAAHQPGLFNRIMQAIQHGVHEEISPLLNEYIEAYITEHSVPNDGRIGTLLHLVETAGKSGDFFIALTAAGKFFEVCERNYEADTFDGWAMRMMDSASGETFEQSYYKQLLESAVAFQAEELSSLGLPGPAEVIRLLRGAMFSDPDVNAMLSRLNVPDGKIGELMKSAEKIGESKIQEYHHMTRVKHTRMLRARRKHSPHKMRANKHRRTEYRKNKSEIRRRKRQYLKKVKRFTKHSPWKHVGEEAGVPAVELSYEVLEVSEPLADLFAEFLDECGYGDAWEASFLGKGRVELTMPSALADCVCDFLDEKIDEDERESLMGNPWAGKEGKLKLVRFTGSDAIKGNSAEQEQTDLRSTGKQELDAAEEGDRDYDEGGDDDEDDDDEEEGGDGAEQDRTRNNPAEAFDDDDDLDEDDLDEEKDKDEEDDDEDEEEEDDDDSDDDDSDDEEDEEDDDDDDEDEPKHHRHEESDVTEAKLCEDTRPHKVVKVVFGKTTEGKAEVVFTGTFMEMFEWAKKNDYTRIDNHASPYGFWWQKKGEIGTEYWIDPVGTNESEDQSVKTVLVTFPLSRAGEFQKLVQRAGGDPKQVHVTETANRREILTATISESLSKRIGPFLNDDFIVESR